MLVFSKLTANLQKNMQNSRVGRVNKYILRNCMENLYELRSKNFGMSKTRFTFVYN
jgi:glucose-6-phosphate 1-dehydrogenase